MHDFVTQRVESLGCSSLSSHGPSTFTLNTLGRRQASSDVANPMSPPLAWRRESTLMHTLRMARGVQCMHDVRAACDAGSYECTEPIINSAGVRPRVTRHAHVAWPWTWRMVDSAGNVPSAGNVRGDRRVATSVPGVQGQVSSVAERKRDCQYGTNRCHSTYGG